MHVVIIWQRDEKVRSVLQRLIDLGADSGVISVAGHFVRLHEMFSLNNPKGAYLDRFGIAMAITNTAEDALARAKRKAEMNVIFIFHQTSRAAVNAIRGALRQLLPDLLDSMAAKAGKDLWVKQVSLLSCESAADKVVAPPLPPVMRPWVAQAVEMRTMALQAFSIRKVSGPGEFIPVVVTFSTGNVETGGVVLNPFAVEFRSLRGHFNPDGTWDYDLDANGQPDETQDPSGGTVYTDTGQPGGAATQPLNPGQVIGLMPFTPADIP